MSDKEQIPYEAELEDWDAFRGWMIERSTDRQKLGATRYVPQSYLKRDMMIEATDEVFDALFYLYMARRHRANKSSLAFRLSDLVGDWEEARRSKNEDRAETLRLQIIGLLINEGVIKVERIHYSD